MATVSALTHDRLYHRFVLGQCLLFGNLGEPLSSLAVQLGIVFLVTCITPLTLDALLEHCLYLVSSE